MTGNTDYSELFLVPTTVAAILTMLMLYYRADHIDWTMIGVGMILGAWIAVGAGCALSYLKWSWERSVQCEVEKRLKEKEMGE